MRAFAILGVVIGHGQPFLAAAESDFPWIPFGDGVDIFFVLSGFLIGGILLKDFVEPQKLSFKVLANFLKRRWFRTLPNYYLVLGLNILLLYFGLKNGNLASFNWKFLWFGQNFAWPMQGFFWESWSLTIEEWFYLLYPIIFLLFYLFTFRRIDRRWIYLFASLVFLALPLIIRICKFSDTIDHYYWDTEVRKVVLMRMDALAYGLIFVWISKYYQGLWKQIRWPLFAFGLGLFLAIDHFRQPVTSAYAQIWIFSLSSLAYASWLPLLSSWKTTNKWIARPILHISLTSYSLYLVHLGLISEVILKWHVPNNPASAWLTFAAYFGLSIVVSSILSFVWERPMMNLRDRF